jgi:hypothetical protein
MRYLVRFTSLWIAFTTLEAFAGGPADPRGVARAADSLSARREWYTASVLFRQAAFLSDEPISAAMYLLKGAENLAALENYHEATEMLSQISVAGFPDTLLLKVKYRCALYAYMDAEFAAAEAYLVQGAYLLSDSTLAAETWLLRCLVLNEQYRWSESAQFAHRLNEATAKDDSVLKQRGNLITEIYNNRPHLKSSKKARNMSTFLPGLGQTYAGYPGEGLVSFVSIAAVSAAALVGIINQYYVTSIVLGNYIFGKFYIGGLNRTEFLVDKRNYIRSSPYNRALKEKLMGIFPGEQ